MVKEIVYMLIIFLAIPAAFILYGVSSEEIKSWRKRLFIISIICFIAIIGLAFTGFEYKIPIIITLFFIILTNLTLVWRSKLNLKKLNKK